MPGQDHAVVQHLLLGQVWTQIITQQGLVAFTVHLDPVRHGLTLDPAMLLKIVRHAANNITLVLPQVAFAILVIVDGIAAKTAGNKLLYVSMVSQQQPMDGLPTRPT